MNFVTPSNNGEKLVSMKWDSKGFYVEGYKQAEKGKRQ